MTRSERLARSTARAAERTAKARAAEAQARAKERANDKEALEKRCAHVGRLAHSAGLFAWENGTLSQLFTLLAAFLETPDPVRVLASLLHDGDPTRLTPPLMPPPTTVQHSPTTLATNPEAGSSTTVHGAI
jgi:hypothetical protein